MKTNIYFNLITLTSVLLAGCNDINLLDKYVEKNITISTSKADSTSNSTTLDSKVRFTNTHYFTSFRTVCDQYICGYDTRESCSTETVCDNDDNHPSPPRDDRDDRPVPRPVPGDEPHPPRPRPRIASISTLGCHTYHHCTTHEVPRYCDTNCRQEPFTDSSITHFDSPVSLKISGLSKEDIKNVKKLALGVHTNQAFKDAITNPSLRPKKSEGLFGSVKATDQVLLVLQAKGLKLKNSSQLINLPQGFKKGDPIAIEVEIEKLSNTKTEMLSAIGSENKLPDLQTSSHE